MDNEINQEVLNESEEGFVVNQEEGMKVPEPEKKAEKNSKIINAAKEIPRSFIICNENGEEKIYLSHYAVNTLKNKLI